MARLDDRRRRHRQIESLLSGVGDEDLVHSLDGLPSQRGWGRNQYVTVDGADVFVKRIPVTEREMANMNSTRNLFGLPTYYNYGVGSAGFGVFRELAAHEKTTGWVMDGTAACFPLLYHRRIVRRADPPTRIDEERIARHVAYWNGNPEIGAFRRARETATFEAILFLERFPETALRWLAKNEAAFPWLMDETMAALDLLQSRQIGHFDVHGSNVLTDGESVYLTDFGLALDLAFELEEVERTFFGENTGFDMGKLYYLLASHIVRKFDTLPDGDKRRLLDRYGVESGGDIDLAMTLVDNVEDVAAGGFIALDRGYVALARKAREIVGRVHDFLAKMRSGNAKTFRFPNAEVNALVAKIR